MNKLVINPPPGCLAAWIRAAAKATLPVDKWVVKACNTAAGHRPSNTGFLGVSDSAPKRMAFRVNWSEGGVKKSTTMAYTPKTREARLQEAFEFLEARERGEPRRPARRGRKPLENAFDVATKPAPDGFEKHELCTRWRGLPTIKLLCALRSKTTKRLLKISDSE